MPEFFCNSCALPLNFTFGPLSVPADRNGSRGSSDATAQAYITNCKHMFCQNCIPKCKTVCVICNKPCTPVTINTGLPPQFRYCFESIGQQTEQFERQIEEFERKLHTARAFQKEQNQNRRHQLMQIKSHYEQVLAQEKANLKEAKQRLEESEVLNRKLKLIGCCIQEQQKQTVAARTSEAHSSTQIDRNDRLPNNGIGNDSKSSNKQSAGKKVSENP